VQGAETLAAPAPLIRFARSGAHRVGIEADERVERRRPRAAIEQRLDKCLRRHVPGADRGGSLCGPELSECDHRADR
jgi:hypothetical protein